MGMYTELNCALVLHKKTPSHIIQILGDMVRGRREEAEAFVECCPPLFSHELFSTARWTSLCASASYYFAANEAESKLRWDETAQDWRLTIRSNLKNYDKEIEKFLDWISPFLQMMPGDFLGYKMYEEDPFPTLLFKGVVPDEKIIERCVAV